MDPRSPDPLAYACAVKRAFPAIPSAEALAIAVHVCRGGRGRTSSTLKGQTLARAAITRAVANHVRRSHTQHELGAVLRAWSDLRSPGHAACAPCWQTNKRHLRTLECDAELAARVA